MEKYSSSKIVKKYCVDCIKEGSYKCALIIKDEKCINFEKCDKKNKKYCFGGY